LPLQSQRMLNRRHADNPDVSNKTLITNANQDHVMGAAALHKLANDYYNWRNENDPVSSKQRRPPHLGRPAGRLFRPQK